MASHTFYGKRQKRLKLGTILHDKDRNQYLLCVQPICDGVRLKENRKFMFVEMNEIDINTGNPSSLIIVRVAASFIYLNYKPRSFFCFAKTFLHDCDLQRVVSKESEDGFYFEDACGQRYYWIDQLRPSHAQRAVEQFASNLSRVGLTESDWLRRLGKE